MIELIDQFEQTSDFHGKGRIFWTITAAFEAAGIAWECPQYEGLLLVNVRKPFDEAEALKIMRFVCVVWSGSMNGRGMLVLPDLPSREGQMDSVVLAGPPHLGKLGTINPTLDSRTIVAFPAFHNEFSGNEFPDLFDDLIHSRSDIGNWNRPCRPQIWMRVDNPKATKRIAPIHELQLSDLEFVQSEVGHLSEEGGSISLKNFMGRAVVIRGAAEALALTWNGSDDALNCSSADEAMGILLPFLLEDRWLDAAAGIGSGSQ